MLNQEEFSKSARILHYHKTFTQAQFDIIASFRKTFDEIQAVNQKIQSNTNDLKNEKLMLRNALQAVNDSKIKRELALTQLRADITSRGAQLDQLEIDQGQLQALIEQINRAVAEISAAAQHFPFDSLHSKLLMPVAWQLINLFGSRYGDGDLSRQGITIEVSEGTPVQAVHSGRVVFSDWLRGSGLLVIVDHGQGYMSLYGANQALSKQAGDWVGAGDIVSASGIANGLAGNRENSQTRPGIYFEIRHHGEAQDPAQWLSQRNVFAGEAFHTMKITVS